MTLFLILLFPLSLAFYCRFNKNTHWAHDIVISFVGFFIGAVFCAFLYFFAFPHYITPASFLANFFHIFIRQCFLPILCLTVAFLICCHNIPFETRTFLLFPFLAGFYAVFLPFIVLISSKPYPFFYLFVKPIMFLLMIIGVVSSLTKIAKSKVNSASIIAWSLVLLLAITIPALIETFWLL